jgi:hypothetical protein
MLGLWRLLVLCCIKCQSDVVVLVELLDLLLELRILVRVTNHTNSRLAWTVTLRTAFCNDAGKTRDPNLAWSHSEAYGSAWENRNLGSIDTYMSCTKGLQKTAYLHLGDCNVKYTKTMKCKASTGSAED